MRISNSSTSMSSTLAPRAAASVALGKKMELLIHMTSDTWDPKTNPDGYINLGVAENYLVKDILAKKLNETFHITPPAIGYGTGPWGSPKLRERFTTLLNKYFHPSSPLKEDNVIFGCGVTALSEALGFTLLGEGDALLLNRPIYGAFFQDFTIRAGNKMIDVAMKGADVFGPGAVEKFEEELIEARKRGINVRVLLLCNPHNPLGASLTKKQLARVLDRSISSFALEDPELLQTTTCARHELMTKPTGKCYSPDILRAYMRLCQKYKIHLVSDEVYGLTVFETDNKDAVPFTSVLSLEGEGLIDKNYLHVLYGMSKDFASNGIRLGCVITRNEELRRALYTLGLFQWATGPSSVAAEGMLEDEKWVEDFLQLSREKIADSYRFITKFFDDEGINYYRGQNAGFFLWTDFSPFLPEVTAECSSGVERERVLLQRIFKAGVFVGSGEEFHSEEPGWIRISFTNDRTSLTEGLKRLVAVARGKNVEKEALTQGIGSIAL